MPAAACLPQTMALQKPRSFTRARGARGLIFIEWLAVLVATSVANISDATANGLCAKAVQLSLRGPLYSDGALFHNRLSWQELEARAATSSMLTMCVASGICTDDFAQ